MSQNEDEKLEAIMRQRRVEPASQDLATRIILKAQGLPQIRNISLWQSVRQLFAEFHLPAPGYVLASALILGMIVGFTATPENTNETNAQIAAQSFLSADEGPL